MLPIQDGSCLWRESTGKLNKVKMAEKTGCSSKICMSLFISCCWEAKDYISKHPYI